MPVAIRIKTTGIEAVQKMLRRIQPGLNPEITSRALLKAAFKVQAVSTREFLSGPRPARIDVVTGTLRRSVSVSRTGLPQSIEIGTDVVYGPTHEYGDSSRNIPARPYLRPAAERVAAELPSMIVDEWRRAAGRGPGVL